MQKPSKEQARKQWGIPDWREAGAYSFPETVDEIWRESIFRWEFLRRRRDYRKDWLAHLPQTVKVYQNLTLADSLKVAARLGSVNFHNFICTPDHPEYRVHMLRSVERYGLACLINPACSNMPVTFVSTSAIRVMEPGGIYNRTVLDHNWSMPNNCCAIVFNYRQPLKFQLERAEFGLRFLQEHLQIHFKNRKRDDKYTAYLRGLDGEAAGATYEDIWKTIYPKSKARNPRECGASLLKAANATQDRITQCQK
ncbi:MAG: hypothetical protein LAP85_29090 [Acidobacteriia bacterium]|nr:hypothetical protein [Terriglobia bacterium]